MTDSMKKRLQWSARRGAAPVVAGLIIAQVLVLDKTNWLDELLHLGGARGSERMHEIVRTAPLAEPLTVTPPRPMGNDSSVSTVPLPLILVRTQLGRNNREGFAQIGVNAQSPQTYSAGALLANGARLTEIYAHYVVLEREGHSVRLYLQGEAQPDALKTASLLTVGGTPLPAPAIARSQENLTAYLRPTPVFVENELHGYALYPGRNSFAFSILGLQAGDVLTEINGAPVTNSADALAALRTLTEGASLAVVIEREGTAQTLSLDGASLARAMAAKAAAPPNPYKSYQTDFKAALRAFNGNSKP